MKNLKLKRRILKIVSLTVLTVFFANCTSNKTITNIDKKESIDISNSSITENKVNETTYTINLKDLEKGDTSSVTATPGKSTITQTDETKVKVEVPEGATTEKKEITATLLKNEKIDAGVELQPSGSTFEKPLKVVMPLANQLESGLPLRLMSYDEKSGEFKSAFSKDGIPLIGIVNDDGKNVTTYVDHFSIYIAFRDNPTDVANNPGISFTDIITLENVTYPKDSNGNEILLYTPVAKVNDSAKDIINGSIGFKGLNDSEHRTTQYKKFLKLLLFGLVKKKEDVKTNGKSKFLENATNSVENLFEQVTNFADLPSQELDYLINQTDNILNKYSKNIVMPSNIKELPTFYKRGELMVKGWKNISKTLECANAFLAIGKDLRKIIMVMWIDRIAVEMDLALLQKRISESSQKVDPSLIQAISELRSEIGQENEELILRTTAEALLQAVRKVGVVLSNIGKLAFDDALSSDVLKYTLNYGFSKFIFSPILDVTIKALGVSSGLAFIIFSAIIITSAIVIDDIGFLIKTLNENQILTLAATMDKQLFREINYTDENYYSVQKAYLAYFFYSTLSEAMVNGKVENIFLWSAGEYDKQQIALGKLRDYFGSIANANLNEFTRLSKIAYPQNIPLINIESRNNQLQPNTNNQPIPRTQEQTIKRINAPPKIESCDVSPSYTKVAPGQTQKIHLSSYATDADKDVLSYEWYSNKTSIRTSQNADIDLGKGIHNITLIVKDSNGDIATSSKVVTIDEVQVSNRNPEITKFNVSPTDSTIPVGQSVKISMSADALDPDGDSLTYSWYYDSRVLSSGKTTELNLKKEKSKDKYIIKVEVKDSKNGIVTREQTVNISELIRYGYRFTPSKTASISQMDGGGTWGSILKMDASISGNLVKFILSKKSGTFDSSIINMAYLQVGSPESFGAKHGEPITISLNKENSFTDNLAQYTEANKWPKKFFIRIENNKGNAWVGPVEIERYSY